MWLSNTEAKWLFPVPYFIVREEKKIVWVVSVWVVERDKSRSAVTRGICEAKKNPHMMVGFLVLLHNILASFMYVEIVYL